MINALTIDVEEYFQVAAFRHRIAREAWCEYPSRLEGPLRYLLDTLEAASIRATFFVLGEVALRLPHLVADIVCAGHEIASHGMGHQLVYEQTEDEFRHDVTESRRLLCEMTGQRVVAYRAPSWSITPRTPWAYTILREAGYEIDSSLFPIPHDIHGNASARFDPHKIETTAGPLDEFPAAIVTLGWGRRPWRIPTGGGGYFRLTPYWLTRRLLRSINAGSSRCSAAPFVFYVHPWEFDPDQPRVPGVGWKSRLRHSIGLRANAAKWEQLLRDFTFTTLGDVVKHL